MEVDVEENPIRMVKLTNILVDLMKYYCCKEFHPIDTRAFISNLISWTNENNEIFIPITVKVFSKSYSQRQNVWKLALQFPRMNWGNQKKLFSNPVGRSFWLESCRHIRNGLFGEGNSKYCSSPRMWSNSNPFILFIMKDPTDHEGH